jgi:hypothetical protein
MRGLECMDLTVRLRIIVSESSRRFDHRKVTSRQIDIDAEHQLSELKA